MYRVLRIVLRNLSKQQYQTLERLTYFSKNTYNNMLYALRNDLLDNKGSLETKLYRYARSRDDGRMLYSQSVQKMAKDIIITLKNNGKHALKYHPKDGHRSVVWKNQSLKLKNNVLRLPLTKDFVQRYSLFSKWLEFKVPTWLKGYKIVEAIIIPKLNAKYFELHVIYKVSQTHVQTSSSKIMGIDLGVDNFATVVISDGTAVIIDGRKAKSVNRWYNKEKARLQSIYTKQGIKTGKKFIVLSKKRYNWMFNFVHQAAAQVIKIAIKHNVSKIAIGTNKNWKKKVNIGKQNNQNFVMLPHSWFKNVLKHKAALCGIEVIETDEAYTSKADALALEPIRKQETYLGKRKHRGLYISSTGVAINADVNGAINIARKAFGDESWKSIPESLLGIGGRGRLTRPLRIRVV